MKKYPLFPSLLLTCASLLFLYSRLPVNTYPGDLFRPIIFLCLVVVVLYLPAYWVTRDWDWAGLLLVVLVLGLFCNSIFSYIYSTTIIFTLVLLWGVLRFVYKKAPGWKHVYVILNIVSSLIILATLYSLRSAVTTIPPSYYTGTWDTINSRKYLKLEQGAGTKPDVYFIILDAYGRADILRNLYGFDNSEFIDRLREKGFIVPDRGRTNYPRTVLSVTSALNMDYIQNFAPGLDASNMRWLMSPWLDHNLVRTSLEKIGYSSVSISTNWGITDNPTTDYYLKSHPVIFSEFERYLFTATPLQMFAPLLQELASAPTYDAHRRSQLNNFTALGQISQIDGPKFVFAHVMLPHPPFVFARDGSPREPGYSFSFIDGSIFPGTTAQFREKYVDQVQFVNSELDHVIDTILQNSETPPIIILQADHGPRMLTDSSAENSCLEESFSTFSAYYLPGMDPGEVPDDITPVNLFRIILDEYFNAHLPLLKNAQYYPGSSNSGYFDFQDVTGQVDSGENCELQ